jgi:hypothetical protein
LAIRDMRHVVNGERRSPASKVLTGAFVRFLIVTPFGRKGEATGAPSLRIEELAAQNIGSLASKFGSFPAGLWKFLQGPMTAPAA